MNKPPTIEKTKRQRSTKDPVNWKKPPIPDISTHLQTYLETSKAFKTQKSVNLSPTLDYIHVETDDKSWGCGYRNIMMLYSSLIQYPLFRAEFERKKLPLTLSIMDIQHTIEEGWKSGLDPRGFREFKGKLVATTKFIGSTEMWVFFRYLNVPVQLIRFTDAPLDLISFTCHFYSRQHDLQRSSPRIGERITSPMILQGNGHSKIIVGSIQSKKALIILDPSSRTQISNLPDIKLCIKSLLNDSERIRSFSKLVDVVFVDELCLLFPEHPLYQTSPGHLKLTTIPPLPEEE
ncbi:putative Zinc finger-containing ubiquitin peptidase 1 [Blattamonas nauphoetae]|uniref:Zinc finger-containing ubiquitin peptidase 1 n=1 Tax=Blattamonas nauphoetae TaxID=2049346 RepID=A0ABQ9XDA6_9EUKA|nr:putative Zinc finger-containing ubiquitin peptidase 1 [Blattamonas nauphoetae]